VFDDWLANLKDRQGKARIAERIRSAEEGHFGDCESLGRGFREMRIHFGPGYRIYFRRAQRSTYILLCGGTKRTQRRDMAKARSIARRLTGDQIWTEP